MASLARLISLFNQCFPRTGVILPIGWLNILHAGATRPMELAGVFVEYIIRFRLRRYLLGRLKRGCVYQCTFPSSIVDLHAGLDVESIDTKAKLCTAVLDRIALYKNTACQQIISLENQCHQIEHMVSGLLHIVRDLIFKQ